MSYAAIPPTPDRRAHLHVAARQQIEATLHYSHRGPVSEWARRHAARILAGWWASAESHEVTRDDLFVIFASSAHYPLTSAAIDAALRVELRRDAAAEFQANRAGQ